MGVRGSGLRRGGRHRRSRRRAVEAGHRPEGGLRRARSPRDPKPQGGRNGLCGSLLSASEEFLAEHPPPRTAGDAFERVERTANFWRGWINHGVFPEHPWQSYLQRSALTLKGLTYAPTGAVLAAATTSLPETPGGERNWDYRYAWIRDSTFMLWGL